MTGFRLFAAGATFWLAATPGLGDTIELTAGGHLAGRIREELARGEPVVVVKVDDAMWVKLPEARVTRSTKSSELAEYRRRVRIAGEDAGLNYQLARWCRGQNLLHQYRYHLQRTVALDPDHSKARAALGYVKDDGQWRKFAEVKREEGLMRVGGRWVLPEAEAMERQDEQAEVAAKKWAKEIIRYRKMIQRGNAEGWQQLEAIRDPLAAWGIAKELNESRGNKAYSRDLRRLLVKLLGRFKTTTATRALVRAVLEESDPMIRDLAVEQLKEYGANSAIATCLPMLGSNDKQQVRRAAAALDEFETPREHALRLVDALVTRHKKVRPAGPGMQLGFSNNGGGGMSAGGKPKVIYEPQKNPDVLSMLQELEPDVDFGYDEPRWREYFARKRTAYSGDLRRDP